MMDQGPGHCTTLTPNLLQFFTIKKNDGEEFAKKVYNFVVRSR